MRGLRRPPPRPAGSDLHLGKAARGLMCTSRGALSPRTALTLAVAVVTYSVGHVARIPPRVLLPGHLQVRVSAMSTCSAVAAPFSVSPELSAPLPVTAPAQSWGQASPTARPEQSRRLPWRRGPGRVGSGVTAAGSTPGERAWRGPRRRRQGPLPLLSPQSSNSSTTTRAGFPTAGWCCALERSFQI